MSTMPAFLRSIGGTHAYRSEAPNRYPLDWLACMPLLAVAVDERDLVEIRRVAEMMRTDLQQPLHLTLAQSLREGFRLVDQRV